ncbi:Ca2+-binding RTX toxin-like protein [Rhizobium mesoamericanum]|uniref:calcium-binding protein n=1 Tax=Rhizobium mesoamericanum TaxID=1079800 RepID=UPI002781CB6E|nr:calcium-binding protein [Rhizobium mesoamericanum]MDQ0562281.1 Ca2+-binding RTX toxin-like protein [Rhizobium mesoamericanum]
MTRSTLVRAPTACSVEGGDDHVIGGAGGDQIHGDDGNDILSGDNGHDQPRIISHDDDYIDGGRGNDTIFVGDGRDSLAGGEGSDTFVFQFHNPTPGTPEPGLYFGPIPEPVSTILDFNPAQDTFAFDAKGLGNDNSGANFINHADLRAGSTVDTFYEGKASGASGEHVVVITDQSFASGSDATSAISGESAGDIIVYHNADTRTVDLAYVTSPDHVNVFAHLWEVDSVSDLANMHLTPSDFIFV